jgi:AcrR family transcriptional regulator
MAKPVKGRRYDSPVRKEQAEQTRTRIVEAAAALFQQQGYGPTTIKQMAERAGVAVDTVYAVFGNKARVLTAWMDSRLSGPHSVGNVMERPEALAIRDAKDHRAQIKAFVAFVDLISKHVWPVNDIMRSAAAVEPQMAAIYREMHGYRFKNMSVVASWLIARGKLRVDAKKATETIWTLASPEIWTLVIDARGWTKKEYLGWLEDTLVRTLVRG